MKKPGVIGALVFVTTLCLATAAAADGGAIDPNGASFWNWLTSLGSALGEFGSALDPNG